MSFGLPAAPGLSDAVFTEGKSWADVLRVSFFMDWAWGSVNDPSTRYRFAFHGSRNNQANEGLGFYTVGPALVP